MSRSPHQQAFPNTRLTFGVEPQELEIGGAWGDQALNVNGLYLPEPGLRRWGAPVYKRLNSGDAHRFLDDIYLTRAERGWWVQNTKMFNACGTSSPRLFQRLVLLVSRPHSSFLAAHFLTLSPPGQVT